MDVVHVPIECAPWETLCKPVHLPAKATGGIFIPLTHVKWKDRERSFGMPAPRDRGHGNVHLDTLPKAVVPPTIWATLASDEYYARADSGHKVAVLESFPFCAPPPNYLEVKFTL